MTIKIRGKWPLCHSIRYSEPHFKSFRNMVLIRNEIIGGRG